MTIVYAVLAAIVGALAGWFGSAMIYMSVMLATGASDREGALAMGAFFGIGPVGGIVGALAGAGLVLYFRRRSAGPTMGKTAFITLAVVVGALFAGFNWLNSSISKPQFSGHGTKPVMLYEIEVTDAGWPKPENHDGQVEMHSFDRLIYPQNTGQRHDSENGLHTVSGEIALLHKIERRQLAYWMSDKEVYYFDLQLPKVPDAQDAFGEWRFADSIGSRVTGTAKPPAPDSPVRLRTKVEWR